MIIHNTSSTGTTEPYTFAKGVTKVAVQVQGGTATAVVQGSLNGSDYFDLIASSTFAATGVNSVQVSTGNFLVSRVRATLTAVGSTDFKLHLLGA